MGAGKPTLATLLLIFSFCFVSMCVLKGCSGRKISHSDYIVAYDPSWYPLQPGLSVHMISAFSQNLLVDVGDLKGLRFKARESQWDFMKRRLHVGEYNALMIGTRTANLSRDNFLYSKPYLQLGAVLVVPQSSALTDIDDMENQAIGLLQSRPSDLRFVQGPETQVAYFKSSQEAVEKMIQGKVAAVIMNGPRAQAYSRGFYKGRIKLIQYLSPDALRLVVLKGGDYEFLVEQFNEGLDALQAGSHYTQLLEKWELDN